MQDLEVASLFSGAYRNKTVLVTGHTGFKGSWLSLWLTRLGAKVVGYALTPPTEPNLFNEARVQDSVVHVVGDIRDATSLEQVMLTHEPEVVFHLAAQPLVRQSYLTPQETYETNVMGTVNLLEAVRKARSVKACIIVTSDKCYENREWVYAYRENDPMGGFDPYSSSKGCAELVTSAYRNSFFLGKPSGGPSVSVASVRAGNVIGGGDWAHDRIVPDCIRALVHGERVLVRNPHAIRPWQHVLEPLSGYLWLGARMLDDPLPHADAWNFGPLGANNVTVREIVGRILENWGEGEWYSPDQQPDQLHEAHFLKLDTTKAVNLLCWEPTYDLATTVKVVTDWYFAFHKHAEFDAQAFTLKQIEAYEGRAVRKGLAWATAREYDS